MSPNAGVSRRGPRLNAFHAGVVAQLDVMMPRKLGVIAQPADARASASSSVTTAPASPNAPRFLPG